LTTYPLTSLYYTTVMAQFKALAFTIKVCGVTHHST